MRRILALSRLLSRQVLFSALIGAALGALLAVYIAYVSALGEAGEITRGEWLQVGLTLANLVIVAALAAITLWYAASTQRIAQATIEQSQGVRAQADLLNRQLVQGVRPIIRFTFDYIQQLDGSNLVIRNIGVGPALNTKCWVQRQQSDRSRASHNNDGNQHQFRISVLEVGGSAGDSPATTWKLNITPTPTENLRCTFFAVYQDIYGNYFASEAVYDPVDQPEDRPLMLNHFSIKEIKDEEAGELLWSGGYQS